VDLSDVLAAIRRRWRIVVVCVLLAGLVVGAYLFTRDQSFEPDRYKSDQRVYVAPTIRPSEDEAFPTSPVSPEGVPFELQRNQEALALSPEVRNQALTESGRPPNDPSVSFSVSSNPEVGVMTLSVVARDLEVSQRVATNWGQAFRQARRDIHAVDIREQREARLDELTELQAQLRSLQRELNATFPDGLPLVIITPGEEAGGAIVPLGIPNDVANQLVRRAVLEQQVGEARVAYAELSVDEITPSPFARVFDQPFTSRIVDEAPSPIVPVALIMLAGLGVGLVGAVIRDRLDPAIRSAKAASAALSAPILATVPPPGRHEEYAVLERPHSERSEAFRTLAATSVATDRLPQAIVVSSPRGDTLDDVAANFAAALAKLGLRVALVATSPEQAWYSKPFDELGDDAAASVTLPGLLNEAQTGRLNGELTRRLPLTEFTPNLLLVPPGQDPELGLPLDGLPPLLRSLADSGVDVTVIAGPPLLEDPNATIVAWSTGTVLWAVQVDELTQEDATEAAARLDLTGVNAFGVVVVGAPES
jgi:capsular polysaccharide biosynthesis protein